MQNRLIRCFSLLMYFTLTVGGLWLSFRYFIPWAAPFIVAFLLAALLEAPVGFLVRRRWRRSAAAGLTTLALLALLVWGAAALTARGISAVTGLAENMPLLVSAMAEKLEILQGRFHRYLASAPEGVEEYLGLALESVAQLAYSLPGRLSAWAVNVLAQAAGRSPDIILFTVTAGIGTYFISASYPRTLAFLAAQLPPRQLEKLEGLGQDLKSSFGGLFRAQLILMALTFFELLIAFLLMGLKNAAGLALFTALVDALPVFGTGFVLLPWAAYALIMGELGRAAALAGLWVGTALLRSCMQAKLLGDQIGLAPLPSLVAIYVGWRVWGVGGMLVFPLLLVTLQQLNDKGVVRLWKNI